MRPDVVRAVASIRLLAQHFVEPATSSDALATALLHQTLSIIAERGGARAKMIFGLIGGTGPFASVSTRDYIELLKHVSKPEVDIIEQAGDGTLMFGAAASKSSSPEILRSISGRPGMAPSDRFEDARNHPTLQRRRKGKPCRLCRPTLEILDIDEKAHVLEVAPQRAAMSRISSRRGPRRATAGSPPKCAKSTNPMKCPNISIRSPRRCWPKAERISQIEFGRGEPSRHRTRGLRLPLDRVRWGGRARGLARQSWRCR